MPRRKDVNTLDGVVIGERLWTLAEELRADRDQELEQVSRDIVGGEPWPADIDAWRARYNARAALDAYLTRRGVNPASLAPPLREALVALMHLIYTVATSGGQPPGVPAD